MGAGEVGEGAGGGDGKKGGSVDVQVLIADILLASDDGRDR